MTDAWPTCVKIESEIAGAPNWRRVPGFPIYATGQPLKDDVGKCVEAALKKYDEQKNVVWISLRQEPCIYVNGKPYNVRATDDMANHLVMTEASDLSNMEQKMVKEIKKEDKFMWAQEEVGDKSKETAPESKLQQGRPDSLSTQGDQEGGQVHVGPGGGWRQEQRNGARKQ